MKERKVEKVISGILIGILIILTIFMIADVKKLQGNARVVNYAGIIRGATQRMVKLEVVDEGNDELIQYLDDIFSGLMHGGGKYNLTHLEDTDYNAKLNRLYSYWAKLKEEVTKVREEGYKDTDIISMSEEYFQLADKMVDAAENCSQRYATQINQIEKALIVIMILIVALLIKESVEQVLLSKKNRELRKKAYLDLHTGLPNKSRCEELLLANDNLTELTTVAIFDLNGLKEVNDTIGHLAGDTLIMNFANILRTSIPQQHFVGRYGGDEFIAILTGVGEEEVKKILLDVRKETGHYNSYSKQLHLEYAYGYAVSDAYSECCSMKILLEQADRNMYKCKAEMKEHHKNSHGEI